jgi:pimeloyl-ACP methyl ester carboxylesterase
LRSPGTSQADILQGVTALAGPGASYYAYYDPDEPETITQAVDDLAEYVQSEGPFDGVLAFSQGAALAAMVIARDIFPAPFAFAIFICGGPPYSEPAWRAEQRLRYYENGLDRAGAPVITIPTVHVVGALDKDLPTCMQLVYLCRVEVRQFYEHPAGHEIPTSSTEITRRMVEVMQKGIERAMLAQ